MNPTRRRWLAWLPGALCGLPAGAASALAAAPRAESAADDPVRRGRVLQFPRDHGAHLGARTEWWYVTGWHAPDAGAPPSHGFQLTFFRSRTGLAQDNPSRFAARHLLFAHAAVSSLGDGRHRHDERIARWSGAPDAALGAASEVDGDVHLGRWTLRREGDRWRARVPAAGFELDLLLTRSQPLLLQGDAGFSRKGPDESQASHYYSEPQLQAEVRLSQDGRVTRGLGRAWLDHEWSQEILHPQAVGWDWVGLNGDDGSALTVFQLRRADGSPLWAGGSFRPPGGPVRAFGPDEVRMQPQRRWRSPATAADYPVHWTLQTPAGTHQVRTLMDAQELDSRRSTGTIYWEGLSEWLDPAGRRLGLGYLEMTGYAAPLRLG